MRMLDLATCFLFSILVLAAIPVQADDSTAAGKPAVGGITSGWIAVEAPFVGDDNRNGWTDFEIATDPAGPFDTAAVQWRHVPGSSRWRVGLFANGLLTPSTDYWVRVTFLDPDGVTGANPQIVGPISTAATGSDAVTAGTATAEVESDEIFVTLPIMDDANANSAGTVEIATGPGGPWTRKCGSTSEANLQMQPKRCRLRSLVPGNDYWIRFTLTDPDGVNGINPQVLGPVSYDGWQNLALGKTVEADPGWGCCSNPAELVDGRIQNDAWFFGYAWTGGIDGWAGGPAGFKHATIDLGEPTRFDRAVVWYHDPASVPIRWGFQHSDDGVTWTDAVIVDEPICRGAETELAVSWSIPSCRHEATFPPVVARYLRFEFDDRTLFRGLHGWAVEIEVFDTGAAAPGRDFEVTNTADSGPGSLRQAILDANADTAAAHSITFAIPATDPGFDGSVFIIQPFTELPVVRRSTTIDGTTQMAFGGDTNLLGPEVVLDGALQASGSGLWLDDDNTVRSLVISGFPGAGITMSWNNSLDLQADRNRIEGCYIGTDSTGMAAVPNGAGISLHGFGSPNVQSTGNRFENNLISGNSGAGIVLCDAAETEIIGNRIGTDRTGSRPLGNGRMGINIICAGAPRNLIAFNAIAFNAEDGITDTPDYRFGVAFTPNGHQGNAVRGNSIFANGGLGINLLPPPFPPTEAPSTVTPNDSCDADSGGNLLQNFPVLTAAVTDGDATMVGGFLESRPGAVFEIELFSSEAADSPSFGQGQTWLASLSVTTDSTCLAGFSVDLSLAIPPGHMITATATDASGNTSEFSAALEVLCAVPGGFCGDQTEVGAGGLDEGSGTTVDFGNGVTGVLNGGTAWVDGQHGGALEFDGSGFIEIEDPGTSPFDLTEGLTLALWIRPDTLGGTQILISKDNAYEIELGKLGAATWDLRVDNQVAGTGTTLITEGVWQHLAVTWDGTTVRYYHNGQPDGAHPFTGPLPGNDENIGIGARPAPASAGGPVFHFVGAVDDVRIHGRALGDLEIETLFTATVSDITPPMRSNAVPDRVVTAVPVAVGLTTDETADCRYGGSADARYADLESPFAVTGGSAHGDSLSPSDPITRLWVRCRDALGNVNGEGFEIGIGVGSGDIAAGLAAEWTFEEGAGCATADVTGNGHDGLLGIDCALGAAPVWTSGATGGGLFFEGSNAAVVASTSSRLETPETVSLSAWIRMPTTYTWRAVIDVRDDGSDGYDLFITDSSRAFLRVNDRWVSGNRTVADGAWHHVAGVFDGTEVRLYVDGVLDASAVGTAGSIDVSAPVSLGHHFAGDDFPFAGALDTVQIHDRALTEIEIFDLYLATRP